MNEPISEEYRKKMKAVARVLDETFNADLSDRTTGFVLLIFPLNEQIAGRMNYISNSRREDMVSALKELIANFEGRVVQGTGAKN